MYYKHLKKWFDLFPNENIIVLFQEDIRNFAKKESIRLYDFLEIDNNFESMFLDRKANTSTVSRFSTIDKTLKKSGKIARKFGLESLVNDVKNFPVVVNLRNKNTVSLTEKVPAINLEKRQELKALFSEDVQQLAELIGRKTPWDYANNA